MDFTVKQILLAVLAFTLYFYAIDYCFHKWLCYISIKTGKKYCKCWDCKNPVCDLNMNKAKILESKK